MARADTPTWLPLDTWAKIMGANPLYFNGLSSNTLFPGTQCGTPWQQFSWQNAGQVARDDLAYAIREAERKIAGEVGYNLIPDWTVDERIPTTRPADPTLFSGNGLNVRGLRKSVQTQKGWIISGGKKTKTLIEAGLAVTRSDPDGDGYSELMTVTVTTSLTDANQIRLFYPGENGKDEWEIRPIKVTMQGVGATVEFDSWQLVDPDLQILVAKQSEGIDAEVDGNYLTTIDAYRVFNDPQSQLQLLWEGDSLLLCDCGSSTCVHCQHSVQDGCMLARDLRLGMFTYAPGIWNAANENFDTTAPAVLRDPESVRTWYYSGWQDKSLDRPRVEMDRFWQTAVAYYAAALLDRPTCACDNVTEFVKKWRKNVTFTSDAGAFQVSPYQIDNNLGSSMGALFALKRIDEEGRKIGR